MFGILFPWPDKAEQLSINFETVSIVFPELYESRKNYIEINKKAVKVEYIFDRMFIRGVGLWELIQDLNECTDKIVER